ncbi:uncharacterized protein N7503_007928 [Penicillium pulvis]|uniref:uncharacterized protein n=1 Tax=Penicillium pulvis TaxID=1562058 RepID=UPI002548DA29|nr:uncharacterized protein N7503_007928 [Penicillium pulvis]KAJ5798632.1 hypothetical protein N7503_007928 [Penicillium pulvis]
MYPQTGEMCGPPTPIVPLQRTLFFKDVISVGGLERSPAPSSLLSPRPTPYPNPGYFGTSSHTTIFDHISAERDLTPSGHDVPSTTLSAASHHQLADNAALLQGAGALRHLLDHFQLSALRDIVTSWLAKGANLALAEPLVEACAKGIAGLVSSVPQDDSWHISCASHLLHNSSQILALNANSTFSEFLDMIIGPKFRKYFLRKLATKLSDWALEICLSLDCLNDIQLVLQYENFIMHSFVDGDHSYHSWRKLGDVISSIFALGYHEDIDSKNDVPFFLKQLRKTAFARIYSADKNVAIFLGRPPRMTKRFCFFQIPLSSSEMQGHSELWDMNEKASYQAETRWSALCASLKEEILELTRKKHHQATSPEQVIAIQNSATAQWGNLPPHMKLKGDFEQSEMYTPFEQDFLISVRLNYLHVQFLLRLLLLSSLIEPDVSLVAIAEEMLSRVVEAILMRQETIDSGTSLVWKIVHYGLPAAGIVVLSILKQMRYRSNLDNSMTKAIRDLSVFVAGIQKGSIVLKGDPIYSLLSKATQTIQRLLDSFYSGVAQEGPKSVPLDENSVDDWAVILGQDFWDFETGFWENLADHPSLVAPEETRFSDL